MIEYLNELAAGFSHTMADAIGYLQDEHIALAITGILVAVGVIAVGLLVARTFNRVKQIRAATAAIEGAIDEPEFARHFDSITADVEAQPMLAEAWLRFKSTLVFSQAPGVTQPIIKCTSPPQDFFTPVALQEHWRDFRALPGLFLTTALLLTLIGVVGALTSALKAVGDGGAVSGAAAIAHAIPGERLQAALRKLLDTGSSSFSAAVAGLLASLVLSAAIRICAASVRAALAVFVDAIHRRIALVSFEAIVLERLGSSGGFVMPTMSPAATDDATERAVASALDLALPSRIDAALAKVVGALQRNVTAPAATGADTSKALTDQLGQMIDERIAGPVRAMAEQLTEQMTTVRGHMVGLVDIVNDGMRAAATADNNAAVGRQTVLVQPDLSKVLRAIESSQVAISQANSVAMRGLSEDLASRMSSSVAGPMGEMAVAVADVRARITGLSAAAETSGQKATANVASQVPAPDMAPVLRAIEASQTRIAEAGAAVMRGLATSLADDLASRLATNIGPALSPGLASTLAADLATGLADDVAKRLATDVGQPIREMAVSLADVRARVGARDGASADEVRAAVREALDESRRRTDAETAALVRDLAAGLAEDIARRLEASIGEPLGDIASGVSDMHGRLDSVDAGVAHLGASQLGTEHIRLAVNDAIDRRQGRADAANVKLVRGVVSDLIEELGRRIDGNVRNSMQQTTAAIADVHAKLADLEAGNLVGESEVANGDGASLVPTASPVQPRQVQDATLHAALAKLLGSLEQSNERAAAANRAATQQLASELGKRLDAQIAGQMRGMSDAMAEIGNRLAVISETVEHTRTIAGDATTASPTAASDTALRDEIEALRRSLEAGYERIAGGNRAAVVELAQRVQAQLDTGAAHPIGALAEAVFDIRTRLVRVDAAFETATSGTAETTRAVEDSRAHLETALAALQTAFERGSERIVDNNNLMINALAEDVAERLQSRVADPLQLLGGLIGQMQEHLAQVVDGAVATPGEEGTSADRLEAAAAQLRQMVADMGSTLATMTTHAQEARTEHDRAQQALVEQIGQSLTGFDQVVRKLDGNGGEIVTRLQEAITAAPASLKREAESAARSVHTATESARIRLEQMVADITQSTTRETAQATAALPRISEQLVRQSAHAREALTEQLAGTVKSIERASSNLDQAFDRLKTSLGESAQTATATALTQLSSATTQLESVTERSNHAAVHSVSEIWKAATEARSAIEADLQRIREQVARQAEAANLDFAQRLRETATDVAVMMAGYGGELSSTASTLVDTLQAVSSEMRRLESSIVKQEAAQLKLAANGGPMAGHGAGAGMGATNSGGAAAHAAGIGGAGISRISRSLADSALRPAEPVAPAHAGVTVGSTEAEVETAEAVLGRFIESRRAFKANFDK